MAWAIDTAHTEIEFAVKHMMIATVRGHFTKFAGSLDINPDNLEQSSAEGTVEVASVDTRDANRDNHLRSADFFDAEKYPVMSFKSTKIEKAGESKYKVTGPLTIKGVARDVTFDVEVEGMGKDPWGNLHLGLNAQTSINRKDYGLNWNVALETGGWLVADTVKINVDLEAVQVAAPQPAEEQTAGTVAA